MTPPNLIARLKLIARIEKTETRLAAMKRELAMLQEDVPVQRADGRIVGQMEDRRPRWKRGKL